MRALLILLMVLSLVSCDEAGLVGEDFVGEQLVDVVLVDTLSVALSSMIFDSLLTTNTERLLVGHHLDDSLGLVTAKSYFRLDGVNAEGFPEEDAVYEYAELELFYDGYYYYDTLKALNLALFALMEELEVNDEDNNLYNVNSFDYHADSALLVQAIRPRPRREEKVTLRILEDSLIQEIFEVAKENSFFGDDLEDLSKGFVLSAERSDPDGAFIGFGTQSRLLIHYTFGQAELEFIIPLGNALRFNEIKSDRSGNPLDNLRTQQEPLGSLQMNQAVYLQSGVGIALKISLPGINNLKEVFISDNLFRADLILRPIKDSFTSNTPLQSSFDFFVLDQVNRIDQPIAEPPTALIIDQEFDDETVMEIEITDYLKSELDREGADERALLMVQKDLEQSIDRIYIDDRRLNTELKIYVFDYTL